MIRRDKHDIVEREYLYYLMNDVGLLNDYELNEVGISFDEFDEPDEIVFEKLEDYINKKNRD